MRKNNPYKMSDIQKVIDKINEKSYVIDMGSNKIAAWLKVSPESVREAKKILRKKGMMSEVPGNKLNPKIVFLDIETAPLLAAVYQKQVWKAKVRHDNVISDWFILTFSCKYLGSDQIISDKLTSTEAINEDDSRLVGKLWYILSDADIVICHGGDYFDIPNINSRFVLNGFGPPTYYKQIDTLKVAQRQFGFTHNDLNALAEIFHISSKIETTFELWKRCIRGDSSALLEMELYNRHDVEILEKVYIKIRPWIKSHVNLSLYNESTEHTCPHCGGSNLKPDGGFYPTHTGKYPTYKCLDCGATPRARKSVVPKGKNLLVSIPGR